MRILLATSQFAPELGGVPQLLWLYSQYRPGHVALRVLSVQQQPAGFYASFDRQPPFPITRVIGPRGTGLTSLYFLHRLGQMLRQWPPHVLLCGVAYPTAIIARIARIIHHIPTVVYAHSEDVTIPKGPKRHLLSWALRDAAAIITVSHFTANELQNLGVSPDRITIIPPGIEVEPFRTALPHDQWANKWVLLTVARLIARKGQDTVIRALPLVIPHLPQVHYVIVGSGPDEAYLRQLVQKLQVGDHVTFAGRVSDGALPTYYQACHAFAMLTRPGQDEVEGFGISFLEAAAAGKPVIAGNAGGASDAVLNGVTGFLVNPLDIDETAKLILQLAQNPILGPKMGQTGQKWVNENHTAAAFAQKVTTILTTVAGTATDATVHGSLS